MVQGKTILNDFYIEMKHCEQWNLIEWHKKALHETVNRWGFGKTPILDITKNLESHYIFIRRDHFVKLLKELEGHRKQT